MYGRLGKAINASMLSDIKIINTIHCSVIYYSYLCTRQINTNNLIHKKS